jgi:hypothetical protein
MRSFSRQHRYGRYGRHGFLLPKYGRLLEDQIRSDEKHGEHGEHGEDLLLRTAANVRALQLVGGHRMAPGSIRRFGLY